MATATGPALTLEVIVRLDPAVAERAEAVARQNDYKNLSAALAAMTEKMSLNRRMPDIAANDNELAAPSYAGVSFSRLATLARQSGQQAVSDTLLAGKSVSYESIEGKVARQYPETAPDQGHAR